MLRFKGGGKRGRVVADDDTRAGISNYQNYVLAISERDPVIIRDVVTKRFDVDEWLGQLNINSLEILNDAVAKYSRNSTSDTAIRAYSENVAEMSELQDFVIQHNTRPNLQTHGALQNLAFAPPLLHLQNLAFAPPFCTCKTQLLRVNHDANPHFCTCKT